MAILSSRGVKTTAANDTYIHVIVPNPTTGGFDSFRITKENYLKELQAEVDSLSGAVITNLPEVADTDARDALSPDVGNYVTVTDNGDGQRTKDRYMFDTNASDNMWITIGLLPNII